MARVSITLRNSWLRGSTSSVTTWINDSGMGRVTGLRAGSTAQITRFRLNRTGNSVVVIEDPPTGRPPVRLGEDLSSAWESYARAIVVSAPTLADLVIPGPAHSSSTSRDSSDPYNWRPSAAKRAEIGTWLAAWLRLTATQRDSTVLVLDDGASSPPPPVTPPTGKTVTVRLDVTVRGTGMRARAGSTAQAARAEHLIGVGGEIVDLSDSVDLVAQDRLAGLGFVDLSDSVDLAAVDRVAGLGSVDLSASVDLTAADRVRTSEALPNAFLTSAAITGPSSIDDDETLTLRADVVGGWDAITYAWSIPSGVTLIGGQFTREIRLNPASVRSATVRRIGLTVRASGNGTSYRNGSTASLSPTKDVTVNPAPDDPAPDPDPAPGEVTYTGSTSIGGQLVATLPAGVTASRIDWQGYWPDSTDWETWRPSRVDTSTTSTVSIPNSASLVGVRVRVTWVPTGTARRQYGSEITITS